jgi:cell wall-associated NlpC family hydrolase
MEPGPGGARLPAVLTAAVLSLALAQPDARMTAVIEAARTLKGQPYELGGRLKPGQGIDCEGVVFAVAERLTGCGWRSFPVDPTRIVATRALGDRVKGLDPIATDALDVARLQPGDVVLLVAPTENPKEGPIGQLAGRDVWVWHTGVYTGDGQWLVGDHYAGQVVEVPLLPYLHEHADAYQGVFIVRPSGTRPPVCRRHAPLLPSK